ncbi:MAG TPA: cytochrome P450 [Aggregatilineales bacterium]|nr:cytochrome P450 [Aggregatilineales bacterium]
MKGDVVYLEYNRFMLAPDFTAVDFRSPANLRNPHPFLADLREHAPLIRLPFPEQGGVPWLLTRYEDALWLHKDERITKDYLKRPGVDVSDPNDIQAMAAMSINRHVLTVDPPDHTRLRSLVHKAFTPRMIRELDGRIRQITTGLLDAALPKGHMDLISEFAIPLPVTVIADMLGVPMSDQDNFRRWTTVIVSEGIRNSGSEAAATAVLEFIMYFNWLFDQRREAPGDDLISGLLAVEEAGDKLSQQELISMVFLLLVAGYETTVNLIGNGTLSLLQHPAELAKLRSNPALMPSAIEEMLRYNGPVGLSTIRWAMEDIEMHGQRIDAGDMVAASYLSANRDPAVFENPDTFDITRDPNPHIAFGFGIHYCLGAPLARLEGSIALGSLLDRAPNLELGVETDTLDWHPMMTLHGMKAMPVSV